MSSPAPQSIPDFYSALGADPLAKLDQIEDLFRQLATEAETTGDHSRIPQAVEAFKVLRDPTMRQQYDQFYFQATQSAQVVPVQSAQSQPNLATPLDDEAPTTVAPPMNPAPMPPVAHVEPSQAEIVNEHQASAVEAELNAIIAPTASVESVAAMESVAAIETVADAEPEVTIEPEATLETDSTAEPEFNDDDDFDNTTPGKTSVLEELSLQPDVLEKHRIELLRMFYEKRRKNMRAAGMAIGGLDTIVSYSYELLEFHLWVLSEKKWIVREESGALSISALGCENHEKHLIEGLVHSSM